MRKGLVGLTLVAAGFAVSSLGCGDSGSTGSGGATSSITPNQFGRLFYDTSIGQSVFVFASGGQTFGDANTPDQGTLEFFDLGATGKVDLAAAPNDDYATCKECIRFLVDGDLFGSPTKQFFQTKGTIDLGTSTLPGITATLTDVTLVEVTLDDNSNPPEHSTPVMGGACIHIASANLSFPAPPAGWTCDPNDFGDNLGCLCEGCGVADPDCSGTLPITGCEDGQTCTDGKTCMGTPTAWTCAAGKYNSGDGCDCNCGTHDPDCDKMPTEPIVGCQPSEECNSSDACVPVAWTCDPEYFKDGFCDCGCAVHDPDCADNAVATCSACDDPAGMDATGKMFTGSCSTMACPGTINPTNNAVCQ
jgi:hypothetical protein